MWIAFSRDAVLWDQIFKVSPNTAYIRKINHNLKNTSNYKIKLAMATETRRMHF